MTPVPVASVANRARLTADTSSQPEGITRRVLLGVMEAFFRRPFLHLIPLILMLALAASFVLRNEKEYMSVGTLSVTTESLLADLTDTANAQAFGFESIATITANQINELLRTDAFLARVTDGAGVTNLVEQGGLTREQLRMEVGAAADGENIVRVSATTGNPELSFRLADSTITSYRDFVIDADVSQSTSTVASLEEQVQTKQQALTEADRLLLAKVDENPNVEIEDRSVTDQIAYERLAATAERAATQLEAAQDALAAAQLQTDQASAIVAQRLRVVDEPQVPDAPVSGLRQMLLTVVVFAVLGVLLSLALVVLSASLDRTIRVPNDVTSKFGVDVLAVVPNTAR